MVAAYNIAASLSGLISSSWIDRFDRKNSLIFLFSGFLISTLACGLAPSFWPFLIARIAAGAFGGVITSLVHAIIADLFVLSRRGMATGIVMSAFSLTSIMGVPLGIFIADHFSYPWTFYSIVLVGVLIFPLILIKLPHLTEHLKSTRKESPWLKFKTVITIPNLWTAYLLMSVSMLGSFIVIPYLAGHMVGNVGLQQTDLSYTYLAGGLATFITSRLIGKASDRFSKLKLFNVLTIISLIPMNLMTHQGPAPLWMAMILSAFFMVMLSGRMIPLMTILSTCAEPQYRGGFMSLVMAIQQMSSGLAAFIGGLIIQELPNGQLLNYPTCGHVASGFLIASLIIIRKLKFTDTHEN